MSQRRYFKTQAGIAARERKDLKELIAEKWHRKRKNLRKNKAIGLRVIAVICSWLAFVSPPLLGIII
jgi:hypothetical protein